MRKRWSNSIVTLLIETPIMTRRQILEGLLGQRVGDFSAEITQIDRDLRELVRTGALRQPFVGQYQIQKQKSPPRASGEG